MRIPLTGSQSLQIAGGKAAPQVVLGVQRGLNQLAGAPVVPESGVVDRATHEALAKFQAGAGLPANGLVDRATLEALDGALQAQAAKAAKAAAGVAGSGAAGPAADAGGATPAQPTARGPGEGRGQAVRLSGEILRQRLEAQLAGVQGGSALQASPGVALGGQAREAATASLLDRASHALGSGDGAALAAVVRDAAGQLRSAIGAPALQAGHALGAVHTLLAQLDALGAAQGAGAAGAGAPGIPAGAGLHAASGGGAAGALLARGQALLAEAREALGHPERLPAMVEGALEHSIASAGQLGRGDHAAQLAVLADALAALKASKQEIRDASDRIGQAALDKLGAAQEQVAARDEERNAAATTAAAAAAAGIAGSTAALGVAVAVTCVAVAVVVSAVAFGGAGALVGAAAVGSIVVAAAAVTLGVTVAMNVGPLAAGAGEACRALGLHDAAASLDRAAAWWGTNVADTQWFQVATTTVLLACAIAGTVGSLGAGALAPTAAAGREAAVAAVDAATGAMTGELRRVEGEVQQLMRSIQAVATEQGAAAAERTRQAAAAVEAGAQRAGDLAAAVVATGQALLGLLPPAPAR